MSGTFASSAIPLTCIVSPEVGGPMIAGILSDITGNYRAGFTVLAMSASAKNDLTPANHERLPELPEKGALIDVFSWCFRHEPSLEPTRMQYFRMREYVRAALALVERGQLAGLDFVELVIAA